ncbi:MAG: ThiF family adenylyltransferase [Coriobacteriaceae bacterium]|nr:ThiF family adenylyltransferase [Coriobacteriaceae bacterium]
MANLGGAFDVAKVKEELLNLPVVEVLDVICTKGADYLDTSYIVTIEGFVTACHTSVPVIIGVPEDWRTKLIDVFVKDYGESFPFIPHVDAKGKICLCNIDNTLVNPDPACFYEMIAACVNRGVEILTEGIVGNNEDDFISEFDSYWAQLPGVIKAKVDISTDVGIHKISFTVNQVSKESGNRKQRRNKSKTRQRSVRKNSMDSNRCWIVASEHPSALYEWGRRVAVQNGAYLRVEAGEAVLPPDIRTNLKPSYVNSLLDRVATDQQALALNKSCRSPLILFDIVEPNDQVVSVGVLVKNGLYIDQEDRYHVSNMAEIKPVYIEKMDRRSLMSRTQFSHPNSQSRMSSTAENPFEGKKYLLVGCGSVGGYIASMMIKSGCDHIYIVDPELLSAENIFRHVLGKSSLGKSKSQAMKDHLESNVPGLEVVSMDTTFEKALRARRFNLSSFDCVVSAVGNPNVNRLIDDSLRECHAESDAIFVWNEPLDIGCHATFVPRENYQGTSTERVTYRTIFGDDGEVYDVSSYCKRGQTFTRNESGCVGAFVPYSADVSVKSSLLATDLLKKSASGRLRDPVIVSEKGEGYYFRLQGYQMSDVYIKQRELRKTLRLENVLPNDGKI